MTTPEPHSDSEALADDNYDDLLDQDKAMPDPLDTAQREAAEFKDKFVRAVAEMDNLRKRAQRDVEDAMKYSVTSAAKPFLTVADNLARALQAMPDDVADNVKTLVDGIRATQRELQNALEKMGVTAITPKTGDALNPHEHEVMFEAANPSQQNGTIMQVLEQGYKIHDRLLRPARVSVVKNAGQSDKTMDISA